MARSVVIDELHLTIRVPASLPDDAAEAVRRTLTGTQFMTRLRRTVRDTLRAFPPLAEATVAVTR